MNTFTLDFEVSSDAGTNCSPRTDPCLWIDEQRHALVVQRQVSGRCTSTFIESNNTMSQKYEYKFVRLGEGMWGAKSEANQSYQNQIHEHARDGWRLVQVFAPGTGVYG